MTHALQRFSAALFGWIPDLSGIPPRRQATIGVAASIILHILIILLVALLIRAEQKKVSFAKANIKPRGIELTVLPPEPELEPSQPFTLEPPSQPFIDSRGLNIAAEAALNPIFQADENMRAASELPASGDAPLPSQEGRDRPFNAFKTQRSLLGMSVPTPFPPSPDVQSTPAPPPSAPTPPAKAEEPPPPPKPDQLAKTEAEPVAPPPPKEQMREVTTPKEDEIALSTKAPPTAVTELDRSMATPAPPKPAATPRPTEQFAKLVPPMPKPQTARDSGYQPEQEQNRIEGNISNRGKKSVDAVATPLAKYRKQVNDAIGSRWYLYVRDPRRMTLISTGSARVTFFISQQGEVQGIKLESNTANESFADLCIDAVRDAREQIRELKLPTDAIAPLKDGRLECSLTFTFYNL